MKPRRARLCAPLRCVCMHALRARLKACTRWPHRNIDGWQMMVLAVTETAKAMSDTWPLSATRSGSRNVASAGGGGGAVMRTCFMCVTRMHLELEND